MKKNLLVIMLTALAFCAGRAEAKLNVVTTVPDLAVEVAEIGGDDVTVDSIAKGTQDPHYLEPKPSYMIKVSHADLVVAIGLELEIGWLPPILQGARNPKVMAGTPGYLEVGSFIDPLEVPKGRASRAEGDVHPFGSPHFMLDPIRAGIVAVKIAEKLGELDPDHTEAYMEKAKKLQQRLEDKTKTWKKRIEAAKMSKVITYHKTLTYFFDRFGIKVPITLEPKPGIPPTAKYLLSVIELAKKEKVSLIMVENVFDPSGAQKVAQEVPGLRAVTVPQAVGGEPGIKTLDDLYEKLVSVIEGK